MINQIQTLLQGVNKKQAGFGVGAFCVGFGLGLYLNRRGEVEMVIEPEPTPDEVDLEEVAEAYQEALNEILSDYASPEVVKEYTEAFTDILASEEDDEEESIVISPPRSDPSIIAVDLEALHRRDQLIEEHGFTEGMRIYQEEYSMGTEIPSEDSDDDEENVINIFASEDDEWNQEEEERNRETFSGPYILHKDEFWADEKNYTQSTLTYYAGDNMLCSEDNTPVYNFQENMGELKFGHGSGDRNVVYIRNDNLRAEYEIIRDRGHFSVEVLGLEEEEAQERAQLKHSLRKFRPDD